MDTSYFYVIDNHVFSIYVFYLRIKTSSDPINSIIYGIVIETNQNVYVSNHILTKSALQAKRNKKESNATEYTWRSMGNKRR